MQNADEDGRGFAAFEEKARRQRWGEHAGPVRPDVRYLERIAREPLATIEYYVEVQRPRAVPDGVEVPTLQAEGRAGP